MEVAGRIGDCLGWSVWHIALMARFMAKANYPGNIPAFYWTQAGNGLLD
jgi:hypothetical protein